MSLYPEAPEMVATEKRGKLIASSKRLGRNKSCGLSKPKFGVFTSRGNAAKLFIGEMAKRGAGNGIEPQLGKKSFSLETIQLFRDLALIWHAGHNANL